MTLLRVPRLFLSAGLVLAMASCEDDEPEPRVCEVAGTSVNVGSTTGGAFWVDFGGQHYVTFNNTNLNFNVNGNEVILGLGPVECLEDVPAFPGGTSTVVAYANSDGYTIQFADGTHGRFVAGDYFDGTVSIRYEYPY